MFDEKDDKAFEAWLRSTVFKEAPVSASQSFNVIPAAQGLAASEVPSSPQLELPCPHAASV